MSASKKLKIEVENLDVAAPGQKAEIIVDLGNGLQGRLPTNGSEDTTIQEDRWQQFKNELYQSEFWQQYKEKLDNPEWKPSEEFSKGAYKDVIDREIQRAWDESGKGGPLISLPSATGLTDLSTFSSRGTESLLPDIPLPGESPVFREVGGRKRWVPDPVEVKKESAMCVPQNGGRLQRYLVTVEYMGSRFLGWQKQKNRPDLRTVQGAIEEAFLKFVGKPVTCGGSSRTDTGVHALANVCHVDVERVSKRKQGEVLPPHPPDVVRKAVNHFLQKDGGDVMVVDVQTVRNDFHARYQARERTYHYRIIAGPMLSSIFEKDRAWHVPEHLNLIAMQEAAQVFVGHHDFSSFRAAGCQAKSPLKTLDELHVCEMPLFPSFPCASERTADKPNFQRNCTLKVNNDGCDVNINQSDMGNLAVSKVNNSPPTSNGLAAMSSPEKNRCYVITARARSFLYHQVRLLVGTIRAVGSGVLTVEDARRILAAKSNQATPAMAPASGLYLAEVKYDFNDFKSQDCVPNETDGNE